MKKNSMKKVLTSTAAIFTIAALAVPGTSVFAVDTKTINTPPATVVDEPAATANVTVNKDIVLFNADGSDILSPNITYSYDITPATVTNASITTYSPDDLNADGSPVANAVPITLAVRQGVLAAVSTTNDNNETANKVEGSISFGAAGDTHNNDTEKHHANAESVTTVDLSKKVSSSMTIGVDAAKIYDTDDDGTQDNGPGVYRYKIEDVTSSDTLTHSGIERNYKTALDDQDKLIYLDVYTKYNAAHDGLVVYGYVLLKDMEGKDNVSLYYDHTEEHETIKITGFDTDSENTDNHGDDTVAKANLTSDAYHTYNVEVSKKTAGALADTQHNFPFKVELSNTHTVTSLDDFYYVITKDGTALTAVNTNLSNIGVWTLDGAENTNLQLQNGDKIVITGLPADTKIKVKETNDTNDTYTVSAKSNNTTDLTLKKNDETTGTSLSVGHNGTAEMNAVFDITGSDKIEFTNTLKDISVTGLLFNIAPFVFITIAGAVLLVLVMRSKKGSDSKSKI